MTKLLILLICGVSLAACDYEIKKKVAPAPVIQSKEAEAPPRASVENVNVQKTPPPAKSDEDSLNQVMNEEAGAKTPTQPRVTERSHTSMPEAIDTAEEKKRKARADAAARLEAENDAKRAADAAAEKTGGVSSDKAKDVIDKAKALLDEN
ncbi:hypothetical protein WDW86_10075 [Bdellovibrionota bacterium FG-2]